MTQDVPEMRSTSITLYEQIKQVKPRQHRQSSSPGITRDWVVLLDYLSLSKSNRVGGHREFVGLVVVISLRIVILTVFE